jgi:hypothetical protein
MHKISNFTGSAKHGWERMTPSMGFGMSRPHPQHDGGGMAPVPPPPGKRNIPGAAVMNHNPIVPGHPINLSFNIPFNSNLPGPDPEEILYSSTGAEQKWVHPDGGAEEDLPNHALPIHTRNVENLRALCQHLSASHGDQIRATVTSAKPKPVPGMQRGPLTALVTNVCISGDADVVHKLRAKILNETPITLVSELRNPHRKSCPC